MRDIIAKAKTAFGLVATKLRSLKRSASEEATGFVHEAEAEEIFVAEAAKETMRERFAPLYGRAKELLGRLSSRERLLILFLFGAIVGFGIKTVASDYLTIGYRDYTAHNADTYDLIALQKEVTEAGGGSFSGSVGQGGGSCQ